MTVVDVCRACGCTDDSACAGGCWWVADDLCSSCDGMGAAVGHCGNCDKLASDEIGLTLPGEDLGFCSQACFVVYVRRRFIDGAKP